jgi:predicted nucleotidyltransferase
MRKSAALDALFPGTRQGVLEATLTHPEKWWYLSELARFLRTGPSSLQRELSSLVVGGILQSRREGGRTYFKADTRSPIFLELSAILEKTAGLIPTLQEALRPFTDRIRCAFVYGSVARSQERATSDIDLIVIGKIGLADLATPLRKAENRLGRDVNVSCYSVSEFRRKVASGDHFLSTVLAGDVRFVKGGEGELETTIGGRRSQAAQDLEKGAGRNQAARRT